jgi:pimeloyl-ACP methyl ester carboxylesterase
MSPTAASAQADEALVGTWEGALDVGGGNQLPIVFNISRGDDGSLTATMDSPAQQAFGIPVNSVSLEAGAVTMEIAAVTGGYAGTLSEDGTAIEGTWSQGPNSLPLNVTKSEGGAASAAPDRPQEPELPLPYRSMDVTIPNGTADLELAGTLTLPDGDGPFPGVILVSGSGPQNRDEALMGHRPFYVLSDHLTRQGIAVLRYDDRGVGASTGDFAAATSEDFASDAIMALAFLQGLPQVADDAVGIIGHSEGGMVAPMAAVRSSQVAFIVLMAGPGTTGAEILVAQGQLIARAMGTPEDMIALNTRTQTRMIETVMSEPDPELAEDQLRSILDEAIATLPEDIQEQAGQNIETEIAQINSPWFRFFLSYDPRPTLERVTVPVLALNGEKDLQVPWEDNLQAIEEALAAAGNDDATVRMLPGLNHLFQAADLGTPAEYGQITETINPVALDLMSSWILERFGGGA